MPVIEISDIHIPELLPYVGLTGAQLRNKLSPADGLFIAESPKVIRTAVEAGFVPRSFLMERSKLEGQAAELIAGFPEVPVYTAKRELLAELTGYTMTRGVLAAMSRPVLPAPEEVCRGASRVAVLEGVVDSTNMGAIFRSAAALGMDGILLSPTCCDPLLRRAIRVSMGTVFQIPWTYLTGWPAEGMAFLKENGFKTAAMALLSDSVSMDDPQLRAEPKLAIVLGTEGDGLACSTIASCDYTVCIPMKHGVDSLNVAAAGAVAFWELRKREVVT